MNEKNSAVINAKPVAAGGLLDRRLFLSRSLSFAAAGSVAISSRAAPLEVPNYSKVPGESFRPYGEPSKFVLPTLKRGIGQP